jgi:glycosyltransferase involved in cell wall biosynthesis
MSKSIDKKHHKKTVLQVLPALGSGGVERGTIEIAKKLHSSGYNALVLSAGGSLVEKLDNSGIKHIKLNVATKNPLMLWVNAFRIAKIVKEYNVDIIHARSRAPAWSCFLAAKLSGAKFLTTFHGIYNISNIFKKYYNQIMTFGVKVIAVSNFVKSHIIKNYNTDSNKISVIHRGVDHLVFDPNRVTPELIEKFRLKYHVPEGVKVIILPSRMTSWKGHKVLVEALDIIRDMDFFCLMVGDLSKHPTFTKRIKSLINDLKLQSKIQIFGNEQDMLGLYGLADIVLSTSIEPEAFGRTIIEGQSMGKLVIATNIGGASETIENEVTGFHVSPNDVANLADIISNCLKIVGTKKQKTISKSARDSVIQNFSLDAMLKKTLDMYDEIINEK